jgi:hypothetical protein
LIGGFQGLKQREDKLPVAFRRPVFVTAIERIVKLYDEWGKSDEAAKWRKALDEAKASAPPSIKR